MPEDKLNKQSIWFLILAPLGIIFLGYLFTKDPKEGNQKDTNNSIYTLWKKNHIVSKYVFSLEIYKKII